MIKYSLVLLTAAAVMFNVGCDGECCGNTTGPIAAISTTSLSSGVLNGADSRDTNSDGSVVAYAWEVDGVAVAANYVVPVGEHEVCLTVTDNDGLKDKTCETVTIDPAANQSPVASISAASTCTPGSQVDISGSGTDDGSISSYTWSPTSITGTSGEITCPDSGSTTVCLTVIDDEGLASNQVCKTITATVATCPTLAITATHQGRPADNVDPDGSVINGEIESSTENSAELIGGDTYQFNHTWADCPNTTCTWSTLVSTVVDGDYSANAQVKSCIANGVVSADAATHMSDVGSNISQPIDVKTCGSNYTPGPYYQEIKIEVSCTGNNLGTATSYFDLNNPL